ncbi:oxidative damage protection protein [Lysobacter sp. A3-1-A15]|uniref:oxidative damage protection protein n=1 Tax=Novilysobacter viscosus TaxID=3098602 RepID=UPI002EDAF63F
MPRTVYCQFEKRETEGLDFAPWPGALGQRVFENIGKPAWSAWLAHQTMLINENRLSPMNPDHRAFLAAQMERFLFEGDVEAPAGYVPPAAPGA